MKGSLAKLVLMVILWSYLAPAVLAATELDLPVCCRSHGKHHGCTCSMGRSVRSTTPGFHPNSPQCPYRLQGCVLYGSWLAVAKKFFATALPDEDFLVHAGSVSAFSVTRIRQSGRSPPLPL